VSLNKKPRTRNGLGLLHGVLCKYWLPSRHAELMTGTIPGGFESHLITVIGGRFDDPDNLPEDSSEAENRLETPSILGDKDYSNTDLQNDDMSEKRRHSFAV